MAVPGDITRDNVTEITEGDVRQMRVDFDVKKIDQVIDAFEKLEKSGVKLKDSQERVYNAALKYRREMEKAGDAIDENSSKFDKFHDKVSRVTNSIEQIGNTVKRTVKYFADPWGKADQAAYDFGKTLGANAEAIARIRDESIKFGAEQHIGELYNTSIAEMIKLQQDYSKTVGRNLQLSNQQRETLLATSKLMGQNTNEFASKLENMGIGLEKSGDIAAKMFNEASKSGISFEKYSKSVTDNLTKVQSYGFRNGVEGLTSMAKKAA
jgi:methyl-accepting chemotaxis protein